MTARLRALLPLLLLAGCRRYQDFRLPAAPGDPSTPITYTASSLDTPSLTRGAPGEWDASDVLNPSVIRYRDQYWNLYSGFDGRTWRTGLAVSSDGNTWQKRGVILSPDKKLWEGDDYIAANGSALVRNGEILYWFQAGRRPQLGLLRSRDGGQSWTREPQPVLTRGPRGSWDELGVADPYVIEAGGQLYLYYLGLDRAKRQRLGVARSDDGIHWTRLLSNPILELGDPGTFDENGLGEPAVWSAHGRYWMLYTGRSRSEERRLALAVSPDGIHWTRVPNSTISGPAPWNAHVLCDPTVLPEGNQLRVWYGGGDVASPDEGLHGQVGSFVFEIK